jgi:ribosome-binding factor A
MAKNSRGPRARPIQVGEQLRQCLSQMLLEGSIKDHRIQAAAMLTVTEVRMTPDLRLARVLVSVFPDDDEAMVRSVFEGLESATNEVKREIGVRLRLRYTPELRFLVDDSMAYGAHIDSVLKEINDEGEAAGPTAETAEPTVEGDGES